MIKKLPHSDVLIYFLETNKSKLFDIRIFGNIGSDKNGTSLDVPFNNVGEGEFMLYVPFETYKSYNQKIHSSLKELTNNKYYQFTLKYQELDDNDDSIVLDELDQIYTLYFKIVLDLGVEEKKTKNKDRYMFKITYEFTNNN